jgi:GNAT superfamily N-acetyltransferase
MSIAGRAKSTLGSEIVANDESYSDSVILRPPNPEEHAFVFAGWIRSCRFFPPGFYVNHERRSLPLKTWETVLHRRIERLMGRVLVAEEQGALTGFVCANALKVPSSLHYVYVEHRFRRRGVATFLLRMLDADARYTHLTDDLRYIREPGWIWDPTALEEH